MIVRDNLYEYINMSEGDLLLDPDLSVSEIAAQSGYNDINYFSRMFKKHRKMSPTQFRAVSNCQLSL